MRDQGNMTREQQAIDGRQAIKTDLGESEVLVHGEYDQPDPDHKTLLRKEEPVPEFQHVGHEGVGLGTALLDPSQGKKSVEEIEDENQKQKTHIPGGESIDECVASLSGSSAPLASVGPEKAAPG